LWGRRCAGPSRLRRLAEQLSPVCNRLALLGPDLNSLNRLGAQAQHAAACTAAAAGPPLPSRAAFDAAAAGARVAAAALFEKKAGSAAEHGAAAGWCTPTLCACGSHPDSLCLLIAPPLSVLAGAPCFFRTRLPSAADRRRAARRGKLAAAAAEAEAGTLQVSMLLKGAE
jgi:hypothetical protein